MKLNQKRLIRALKGAKRCNPLEAIAFHGEVNSYLLENYLEPFLRGEVPSVGDLDYSRFAVEDVRDFSQYLDYASKNSSKLLAFCNAFDAAKPLTLVQRAFC